MSEVTIVCRAKDPKNCRYHSPASITTLTQIYDTSRQINTSLVSTYTYLTQTNNPLATSYIDEILKSKANLEKIELDYYSTPEGELELEEAIEKEEDLNEKVLLEAKQKRVQERKQAVESGQRVEEFLTPGRTPLFTLPTFSKKNLSAGIENWRGNKHNPHNNVSRIREFVKGDLKKATQLGFLPEGVAYTVKSDHKTTSLLVEMKLSSDTANKEQLTKRVAKIVKAYASANVTKHPDGTSEKQTSFNLYLRFAE